ncbi:MAG: amidase, partial [Dehalococcoidia bacterium]
ELNLLAKTLELRRENLRLVTSRFSSGLAGRLDVSRAESEAAVAEAAVMRGDELGPLHGAPVSIKDLTFTKGIRTTGGSRIYEDFVPQEDAIVVERLKRAGAIIVGKTNTSEFGWAAVTDNTLFGPTRNPWNPDLTSGGSSGGAAASIATCMGPLAIGGDGGGSIRIPASFCGVFGFMPSYGRVPQCPGFAAWETLSRTGPITRTVADAALAMEVIAGRDDRDRLSLPETDPRYLRFLDSDVRGLRVAWSKDLGYATVDPQLVRAVEAAVGVFDRLSSGVDEVTGLPPNPEAAFSRVVGVNLASFLKDKLDNWHDRIDPGLLRFVEAHRDITATEYLKARSEMLEYWNGIRPLFEKYDLLLTPAVAVPPFEIGQYRVREVAGREVSPLNWMAFTYPFNITGQPAAAVPCGHTDEGLPVGLQIIGKPLEDLTVLRAAYAFEQASPWVEGYPAPG